MYLLSGILESIKDNTNKIIPKVLLIQLVEMLDLNSRCCKFDSYVAHHAQLAKLEEARDLNPLKYEFDSHIVYQILSQRY